MAQADGVQLTLTPSGRLRVTGAEQQVDRWLGTANQYRAELIAQLSAARQDGPLVADRCADGAEVVDE